MSGETEQAVSGWTTDTLHSHIVMLLEQIERTFSAGLADLRTLSDERDHRYEQRFEAQQLAIKDAFESAKNAVDAALAAAKEAVNKAEAASERRFESVNEFRQTLSDQALTFMPRSESLAMHAAASERIDGASALSLERLDGLNTRISSIVSRLDQQTDLAGRVDALAATVLTHSSRLDQQAGLAQQVEANATTVAAHTTRLDLMAGRGSGLQAGWGYLVGAIGLAAAVIGIILGFNS